jgi:hypothetical protein
MREFYSWPSNTTKISKKIFEKEFFKNLFFDGGGRWLERKSARASSA